MSILPGLGLSAPLAAPPPAQHQSSRVQELQAEAEWRFEVAFGASVKVKLLHGTAELFGTELAPKVTYTFAGTKAAIFTWHGCALEITGECESEYAAEETPMLMYLNVHAALDNMRKGSPTREGPRVLVVGKENAGKTSLVKLLTAYALKSGSRPTVLNLDPREGVLSIPGTLTCTTFASMLDIEDGWGSSPISGPTALPVKTPLVYHFPLESPEEDPKMFKPVATRMALAATSRLEEDPEAKEAGFIIDTPASVSSARGGYENIQHIVSEFSVNQILVLGSERLYNDLTRRFASAPSSKPADEAVNVVRLDVSGGCVERDRAFMKQVREAQIRAYFFGDVRNTLSPSTQVWDFEQLRILRVVDPTAALNPSFLPGDHSSTASSSLPIFESTLPSLQLQNQLLATKHADPADSHPAIRDATVMGFVYVADVDEAKKKVRLLAPSSARVEGRVVVGGSWPEGVGDLVA
ncbi:hypothetical protein B0A49_07010 [Cryomyces minteri]|uniref:Polynucleotide 5'-hydroxyl-kinase GRC3 n=1 Tax=Cryomyces minteri TaxID=331657 RepID=A0A4U0WHP3_9PEZI|nr:hypothetical protein B0A49_07010 [Cryomyces minteri]